MGCRNLFWLLLLSSSSSSVLLQTLSSYSSHASRARPTVYKPELLQNVKRNNISLDVTADAAHTRDPPNNALIQCLFFVPSSSSPRCIQLSITPRGSVCASGPVRDRSTIVCPVRVSIAATAGVDRSPAGSPPCHGFYILYGNPKQQRPVVPLGKQAYYSPEPEIHPAWDYMSGQKDASG